MVFLNTCQTRGFYLIILIVVLVVAVSSVDDVQIVITRRALAPLSALDVVRIGISLVLLLLLSLLLLLKVLMLQTQKSVDGVRSAGLAARGARGEES